jgi:hypothetical protein
VLTLLLTAGTLIVEKRTLYPKGSLRKQRTLVALNPKNKNNRMGHMSKDALKQTAIAVGLTILYGLTISQANAFF